MEFKEIPEEYYGWWQIMEMPQWVDIDLIGTPLISFTGDDDRLRVCALLAHVTCLPTDTGLSFTWHGAWEYDQLSGLGSVELNDDGTLSGIFKINNGDQSSFLAKRTKAPSEPIPDPPSYQDKWQRRW